MGWIVGSRVIPFWRSMITRADCRSRAVSFMRRDRDVAGTNREKLFFVNRLPAKHFQRINTVLTFADPTRLGH
jgi:hypothetical protein